MDRSFTLNLNPISVKTIKEYEKELEALKAENFELKHRLSQQPVEIKKLIHDSEKSINILEEENYRLKSSVDNGLQDENDRLYGHIEVLNNRIVQISADKSKIEEELKRVQEELKRTVEELKRVEEELKRAGNDNSSLKNENIDLMNENLELKTHADELENQIDILKNEVQIFKNENSLLTKKCREYENVLSSNHQNFQNMSNFERILNEREQNLKEFEKKLNVKNEELSRKNEELSQKEREVVDFSQHFTNVESELKIKANKISDLEFELRQINLKLDETVDELEKSKEKCQRSDFVIKNKENRIRELEDAVLRNEKDQANLLQKFESECEERIKQNETFMTLPRLLKESEFVAALKMIDFQIDSIYAKIEKIEKAEKISDKNLRFLHKLDIKGMSIGTRNALISELREKIKFMNRKNIELEKEIDEINEFVRNNKNVLHEKTISLLNEFGDELENAKKDLMECQEYLVRKGDEIKMLKKENRSLTRQISEYREEKRLLLNKYVNVMEKFKVSG